MDNSVAALLRNADAAPRRRSLCSADGGLALPDLTLDSSPPPQH